MDALQGSEGCEDEKERPGSESSATNITLDGASTKNESKKEAGEAIQSFNTGSDWDKGKEECSSVPSQSPQIPSPSEINCERQMSGNLIIVPTVDDNLSDNTDVEQLPDNHLKGPEKDHFLTDTVSDSVVKSKNDGVSMKSDCNSGAVGGHDRVELVLPSMGILPEVEGTPVKHISSPSASSLEQADSGKNQEKPCPEIIPVDPSSVVHKIKKIKWQDIEVPVITQNNNGPCPLLAIVNVMLLKGQITLPSDRSEISGGDLVLVVGNALFDQPRNALSSDMKRHLEQNTEDAISILHKLLTGLDVNIKFSGVRDFEFTGELCVFDLLGIMLYHGWVVDPTAEVAEIINGLSYNQLTNNIFAWREEAIKNNNNDLLVKAMLCEEFMSSSGSQLTIHGLFELGSALQKEEIAVLFRNNHFSTIYKKGDQLYQLLTDQGFLHENMVWETLNDVDATFSEFVNGSFQPVAPAPEATSAEDPQNMTMQQQINSDQQLAAMLQHEVDLQQRQQQSFERLKDSLGLHDMSDEEIAQKLQEEENRIAAEAEAGANSPRQTEAAPLPASRTNSPPNQQEERKKKDCVIL